MIDLQAMVGDSVDNVPGIPGIGPKTAAQLLEEFGDLETLLARAGEIKQQKRRENIIANAELARISRKLVELRTDVPLDIALDALTLEPQDGPKLIAFLKAMEFTTLTRRVAEATGADASAVEAADVPVERADTAHGPDLDGPSTDTAVAVASDSGAAAPEPPKGSGDDGLTPADLAKVRAEAFASQPIDVTSYVTIRDLETLKTWITLASEAGLVAFDTETTSLDPMQAELVGFSLALVDNTVPASKTAIRAAYVPLLHKTGHGDLLGGGLAEGQIAPAEALAALKGCWRTNRF